ncbi:hypothetical protein CLI64_08610 [Nostoc sp. CENA543]|uniref:hypothetical protein n=1 Tax=Nostoc sp. CENA543 TaxID=1869241 RepID=UPI000CA0C0F2|nr:hypothetical protein [Nostoc sp. CENA543]AUT00445.1 hypothetical protein CLI64_08610 [Nostoc sp. CENA543]
MRKKLLLINLATLGLLTSTVSYDVPAIARTAKMSLEKFPNGRHLICTSQPPKNDEAISVTCFRFLKQGNRIKGYFYITRMSDGSICIDGKVKKNIVNGEAVYFIKYRDVALAERESSKFEEWGFNPRLRTSRARAILDPSGAENNNFIHYRRIILDLNGMKPYKERNPGMGYQVDCFPYSWMRR